LYATTCVFKTNIATPCLLRPDHRVSKPDNMLLIEFNSHDFTFLTRKTMYAVREMIPLFVIDMGLVIQSNEDDELPENMLMCARFCHLNNTSTCPRLVPPS
jgi:hypothetical protein